MAEALPCPFCGVSPEVDDCGRQDDGRTAYVECMNEECPVMPGTKLQRTRLIAVLAWNVRIGDDNG